ncbi:MAG TPA: hypothetical protein VIT92_10615 [Burkholderiaceae bacterium]
MPSIGDIANESKALLEDIKINTLSTRNIAADILTEVNQVNAKAAQIDNHIIQLNNTAQTGFTNLAQGLAISIALQQQNNLLAAENNKQNAAIICWLDNIANVLCDIKRNTDKEVALQTDMTKLLTHIDAVVEQAHPGPALAVAKIEELEARIAHCCPDKPVEPEPCFRRCEAPQPTPFEPVRHDWKPVHYDRQDQPPR